MQIKSITGVTTAEDIKVFKPISKLIITSDYNGLTNRRINDVEIRVRLVDGGGNTREVVPKMPLAVLSEIAAKHEGFFRRAVNGSTTMSGYCTDYVLLGQMLAPQAISGCDLTSDKYLDIELYNLDPAVKYTINGMETHIVTPFIRKYEPFTLSVGETQKTFGTGVNEELAIPLYDLDEIQFYQKSGKASPIYTSFELACDADTVNDIVYIGKGGQTGIPVLNNEVQIICGADNIVLLNVEDFSSFDLRTLGRSTSPYRFWLIDTVPTN